MSELQGRTSQIPGSESPLSESRELEGTKPREFAPDAQSPCDIVGTWLQSVQRANKQASKNTQATAGRVVLIHCRCLAKDG